MTDSQVLSLLLMDTGFAWKCQGTAENACQKKKDKSPTHSQAEVSWEADV